MLWCVAALAAATTLSLRSLALKGLLSGVTTALRAGLYSAEGDADEGSLFVSLSGSFSS